MQTKATSLVRFWFCLFIVLCLPVFLVQAQVYDPVWNVGLDDSSIADFHQEDAVSNPPPGSPTALDDDYYFAGQYADPIGFLAADEPWSNFERALCSYDPTVRIHFNLTERQALPGNNFRLTTKFMWYGSGTGGPTDPVPYTFSWNDVVVGSGQTDTDPLYAQAVFNAGTSQVMAGENTVTLSRATTGWAWICMDFVKLEVEMADPNSGVLVSFGANPTHVAPHDRVTLSWTVDPAVTALVIDQGVGDVLANTTNGVGSFDVFPATTTTYTLAATKGGGTVHASMRVVAVLINSFTATPASIRINDPAILSWNVAPGASLSLDPGVGNVDAYTTNGIGNLQVWPPADTTYTLTATRGADSEQMSVTVTVNPRELVWQLGYEDNSQAEFHQEGGGVNPPPGSPTAVDNDFYFAGMYPDPIGLVPTNEPFGDFERALTSWDYETRIHFNLTEAQAAPGNNFYVTFKLFGFNTDPTCCDASPSTWIWVNWNDNEILSPTEVFDPTTEEIGPLVAGTIGAVPGANVLTIVRTNTGNAWIQFDFARAEVEMTDVTAGLIVSFDASPTAIFPGQTVTLSWRTDPLATLTLDQGIGDVSGHTVNGVGSIQVSPTETTTYTLTSSRGAASIHASVRVVVTMINGFTASRTSIQSGEYVTLNWQVDPAASVSIAPTFGSVDTNTTAGAGSLIVAPPATTTYILTVTKPGFSAQVSVTIVVNPYARLWELGYEDDSTAEFHQENGFVDPPPGSPTAVDDDYYFAGTYPDPIGVVATDEPFGNFERALKPSDYVTRIHFNLTAAEAAPENIFRVTYKLFSFNNDPTYNTGSVPWVTTTWNDTTVLTNTDVTDPTIVQAIFTAGDVGATPGDNLLTIQRSTDGNEWIQFDYVKAEYYNPSSRIWELGYADNSQADFHQEGGGVNPPPGSPTAVDNDYYYAGTYPALNPSLVQANEAWGDFERALTSSEDRTRIHYNLTAAEAAPENVFYVTFKLFSFNNDPTYNTDPVPWVTTTWNDTPVATNTDVTDPTIIQAAFTAGAVGAVAGENVLTIQRSPDGNAWIQFDYIKTEAEKVGTGGLRIAQFGRDPYGFSFMWNSVPGRTYRVQSSTDLKTWTTLADPYPVGGATDVLTSYTDTTAGLGEASRFYRVVDLVPSPLFFDNFETDQGGWEVIDLTLTDTTWVLGTPQKGPGAAHSGVNAYCTDLVNNYMPGTEIFLISPVINLAGVTNAVLEFWNYRDMEAPQGAFLPDYGAVEILDENGEALPIPAMFQKGGTTSGWRREQVRLPPEALDRSIRIQFHFSSDAQNEGAGWFIDDVAVLPK